MPKESDDPNENFRKAIGGLYDTKNSLVTTTDTVVKEVNTDMVDKKSKTEPNVVKEAITPPISKKILTESTKHRYYKHPIKQ